MSSHNVISSVSSTNTYLAFVVGCGSILALFTVLVTCALVLTRDAKLDYLLNALCTLERPIITGVNQSRPAMGHSFNVRSTACRLHLSALLLLRSTFNGLKPLEAYF